MNLLLRRWRLGLVGVVALGLAGFSLAARADDPPVKAPEKPAEPPKEGEKPADKPADKPAEKPAEAPKPAVSDPILAPDPAKDFTLKDLEGKERKLSEFKGKWVVLEWTNYDCPFVKKHYKVTPAEEGKPATPGRMAQLQTTYCAKDVVWLSICSSAPGKEGHMSAEKWKEAVKERMASPTAVLLDEDGTVGRLYGAKNTPTVWIVDPKGNVGYHGAVDDTPSPKGDPLTAKNYLAEFLDAVLAGKEPPTRETKPYG